LLLFTLLLLLLLLISVTSSWFLPGPHPGFSVPPPSVVVRFRVTNQKYPRSFVSLYRSKPFHFWFLNFIIIYLFWRDKIRQMYVWCLKSVLVPTRPQSGVSYSASSYVVSVVRPSDSVSLRRWEPGPLCPPLFSSIILILILRRAQIKLTEWKT
jgi:hypothetical protein